MKNAFTAPLRGGESDQLRVLFFLRRVLLDDRYLDGRLKRMKIFWRYRGLVAQMDSMIRDIVNTVPPDVWERFKQTMDMQEMKIVTRGGAVDPSGNLIVVPKTALFRICNQASKECYLCEDTVSYRANCPYRKALKDISLLNLSPLENNGICMGKQIDWEV